ncbi:MAG: hypothetical protein Q4G27_10625 [Flavobacteriaceae bacterium]|nr:hypothetical protein [Flavobacteriaceae bacterium]
MTSTDGLIKELDDKVLRLLTALQKAEKENLVLRKDIDQLEADLDSSKKELKALENKNKEIRVASALAGSAEHKRLMKHKLNSLVKEIDLCIAEVKKKSI